MAKPVTAPMAAVPRSDLGFFLDGRHTDVEFLVENGSDPPKSFRAHKMVLAMRNEVFEVMFYGNLPEQDKVCITDLHPDGFSNFLKYLYSQSAVFVNIPQALYTRTAAHKYLESKLVEACDAFIIKEMKPADVCNVIDYTIEHENLTKFEDQIAAHLEGSGVQVLESNAFISASGEAVIRILKNPRLKDGECHVIVCVYTWVLAHRKNKTEKPCAAELQESMKPFLPELRLTLSPEQFISGPNLWNIFTESDAFSVLSNIIQRGSKSFPEFVSTVAVDRLKYR